MAAAVSATRIPDPTAEALARGGGDSEVVETTLLELVRAVSEVADNEREVVATVLSLLHSGKVRLTGNFRGSRLV